MSPERTPFGFVVEQHRASLRERWQMARTLFLVVHQTRRVRLRKRLRLHARTLRTVLRPNCQAAYLRPGERLVSGFQGEFERRVKKVIVAHAIQAEQREHARHDLRDCTFSTDVMDGHQYSSWTSDSATMNAEVRGPCCCGATLRVTAEWPGYDLGKFFQAITDDAT